MSTRLSIDELDLLPSKVLDTILYEEIFDSEEHVDISYVENLFMCGASTEIRDVDDQTVLNWSVTYNNLELLKLSIKYGADLEARDKFSFTALHGAIIEGRVKMVKLLLEAGADINARDKTGWTPLHTAARFNNINILKLLISFGADTTIKNDSNKTAWAIAMSKTRVYVPELNPYKDA